MLIYILLAIISPVLLMSYIVIRKKSETNKSFFQTIKTCSDENFILQCGIISNTKDALVALKIRNVIASNRALKMSGDRRFIASARVDFATAVIPRW